jgi:hypothetical protein
VQPTYDVLHRGISLSQINSVYVQNTLSKVHTACGVRAGVCVHAHVRTGACARACVRVCPRLYRQSSSPPVAQGDVVRTVRKRSTYNVHTTSSVRAPRGYIISPVELSASRCDRIPIALAESLLRLRCVSAASALNRRCTSAASPPNILPAVICYVLYTDSRQVRGVRPSLETYDALLAACAEVSPSPSPT